jgi:hypothetical protein
LRRVDHELNDLKELIIVGTGTGKERLVDCLFKISEELGWCLTFGNVLRRNVILDLLLKGS